MKDAYGTSVSTLRELFNRLASEGLVAGRGLARLPGERDLARQPARNRGDARAARRPRARAVIPAGDIEWEGRVVAAHHKLAAMERQMAAGDASPPEIWRRYDWAFHHALISACGSRVLLDMHAALCDKYLRYQMIAAIFRGQVASDEHRVLLECAIARDCAARAVDAGHAHRGLRRADAGRIAAGRRDALACSALASAPRVSRARCAAACCPIAVTLPGVRRMTVSPPDRLRIGVLGAARIARLFIDAVRPSSKVAVTAFASRDAERAAAFARDTGVARSARDVRRAARRSGHRRRLRAAAQQPARAMVDPRRRGRQARAVREAARRVGGGGARDVRRRAEARRLPGRGLSLPRAAADDPDARAPRRGRDRSRALHAGGVRLPACRCRQHPHASRSRRRRADGRRVVSGQPRAHRRRRAAAARARDGALVAHRRRHRRRSRRSSSRAGCWRRSRARSTPRATATRSSPATRGRSPRPISTTRRRRSRRGSTCAAAPAGMRRAKRSRPPR